MEVALPEEKWVVTFFPDGRVAVEVFSASGAVDDESALARLLDSVRRRIVDLHEWLTRQNSP